MKVVVQALKSLRYAPRMTKIVCGFATSKSEPHFEGHDIEQPKVMHFGLGHWGPYPNLRYKTLAPERLANGGFWGEHIGAIPVSLGTDIVHDGTRCWSCCDIALSNDD